MKIADWAQVVMAVAAVGALGYAVIQVQSQRRDAREQTAKQIWTDYHVKGLEYPQFSNPKELSKLNHEKETLNGSKQKYLEYTWFVSFLLLVCDEILRLRGGAHWEKIVINNLRWHQDYLEHLVQKRSADDSEYEVQSSELKHKIDQVVNGPRDPSVPKPKRRAKGRSQRRRKSA